MTIHKNKMDKENYPKERLLNSLNTLEEYIENLEEGEKKDKLDLHLAFIIQEINTKTPFIKTLKNWDFCSYCWEKRRKINKKLSWNN